MEELDSRFKDKVRGIIWGIILLGSVFALGWSSGQLLEEFNNKRTLNGLYLSYASNRNNAKQKALTYDSRGDWVCINVAYDMSFEEAIITCEHECSHKAFSEIWAEKCEGNFEECLEHLGKI